ncbi:MAG: hypothetical protein U0354_02800 [Candidatus Sericytochromatia bacterium]
MKKNLVSLFFVGLITFACTNTPTNNQIPASPSSPSSPSSPGSVSTPSSPATPASSPSSPSSPSSLTATTAPTTSTNTSISCSNEEPVVGTEYTDIGKFVCATDAKLNSKWTYTSSAMGITSDISVQIVEQKGDQYVVESEVTVAGKKQVDRNTTPRPSGYSGSAKSTTKYKYVGKESVTVGAGVFDCYKFTGSEVNNGVNTDYVVYLAKTRGFIKMNINIQAPVIGTMTTEVSLKAFQQ